MNPSTAYLSLGSNLGAREATVLRAIHMIDLEIGRVLRASSLYETDPVGCAAMPDFVNAVVEVQPLLSPRDLLKRIHALEKRLGRRGGHNEPRSLDIDIIALGNRLIATDELVIPHPRYRQRLFVLMPLREIGPEFRCPLSGEGIDSMLAALPAGQRVVRVSGRRNIRSGAPLQRHSQSCILKSNKN